jgi:hypothetical protein
MVNLIVKCSRLQVANEIGLVELFSSAALRRGGTFVASGMAKFHVQRGLAPAGALLSHPVWVGGFVHYA